MEILLGTVFVASLMGSLHCVGMCGPFALLASANAGRETTLLPTFAYSVGRLSTYVIVGFIFGSLGMAINLGSSFAPWQQTATYAAGILMIGAGIVSLARQFGWRIKLPQYGAHVQPALRHIMRAASRLRPIQRAYLIGATTCLMPCGWLYAFAIVAAGTGTPIGGAAIMAAFWSGTVPMMIALVLGLNRIQSAVQQRIPMAMAGLVIAIGFFTIMLRAPIELQNQISVVDQTDALIQQVREVKHDELPCCGGTEDDNR